MSEDRPKMQAKVTRFVLRKRLAGRLQPHEIIEGDEDGVTRITRPAGPDGGEPCR